MLRELYPDIDPFDTGTLKVDAATRCTTNSAATPTASRW